jgi:hypothetical protein
MKLGMYIMAPEPISTAYFINPSTSNTNIAPSQIVAVITLILLEYLNQYSRNLGRTLSQLGPSQRGTS